MQADLSGYIRETGKKKSGLLLAQYVEALPSQPKKPICRARTRVQPSTKTLLTLVGLDGSMRPNAEASLVSRFTLSSPGQPNPFWPFSIFSQKVDFCRIRACDQLIRHPILLTLRLQNLYGTLTTLAECQPAFTRICQLCQPSLENDFYNCLCEMLHVYERPRG